MLLCGGSTLDKQIQELVSNFFEMVIIPMPIGQSLNMRPLFDSEFKGLSEFEIKNSKKG